MIDPKAIGKIVIPILTLLILCYLNFVAIYSLGYEMIYKSRSNRSVAISLWCLVSICDVFILLYWSLVFVKGPGRAPKIKPFDLYNNSTNEDLSPMPEYFLCDSRGFPFWCSNCESIKLPRSYHLRDLGYCTLKFDHYCLWVGTAVGQENYGYFLKFVLWCLIAFLTGLIYLANYTNAHDGANINKNFIFGYILCGFFIIFLVTLLGSNIWYIMNNVTTIDDLNIKNARNYRNWKETKKGFRKPPRVEDGKRYVNYKNEIGERVIIEYDIAHTHPFSFGFRNNWINIWRFGNSSKVEAYRGINILFLQSLAIFLIPLIDIIIIMRGKGIKKTNVRELTNTELYEEYCDTLNEGFEKYLTECIGNGKNQVPSYLSQQVLETEQNDKDNENRTQKTDSIDTTDIK